MRVQFPYTALYRDVIQFGLECVIWVHDVAGSSPVIPIVTSNSVEESLVCTDKCDYA